MKHSSVGQIRYMQPTGGKGGRTRGRARRRGAALVLTSLALVALLLAGGAAINYGFLVGDANRVQRACDAAALAASQDLGKTLRFVNSGYTADQEMARRTARLVARQNGVNVQDSDVTFSTDSQRVTVSHTFKRPFFFAGLFGRDSGLVRRSATAGLAPLGRVDTAGGLVPIGITWETFRAHQGVTDANGRYQPKKITLMRQNKDIFARDVTQPDPDPAVLFDLRVGNNGKSGAQMLQQLIGAESVEATVGDFQNTLNSSLSSEGKKLEDGLDTLITRAQSAPWNDYSTPTNPNSQALDGTIDRTNPRVIDLIVTTPSTSPQNGTYNTQIQGFSEVYVVDVYDEVLNLGIDLNGRAITETVKQMSVIFLPPRTISNGNGEYPAPPGSEVTGTTIISLVE